ncbi:sulfotransferase ssu-1-like [Ixodes scapularis]|uniref:sulfotransferase ssu-1-like n=1 Tax=Ixodes scapularis TaxID=6945 RepID=UPI001A9F996F|nr:sulfotransferase ssu-1-like [Ixodes scapularis]
MEATKWLFQVVDGTKLPLGFDPDNFRSCLKYEPSKEDIFIDTFPKCGTNWIKRIVQLLLGRASSQENDYGLSTSFLQMVGKDVIASLPRPRIITSHLEHQLLPQHTCAKYIYVVRNPKDCCTSYYHHTKATKIYNFENATFDEYVQIFINGGTTFGDYFSHLTSWYRNNHADNVLCLTYEGITRDHAGSVLQIAKFLDLDDPELLNPASNKFKRVVDMSSLEAMKEYFNVNYKRALGGKPPERWTARKDFPLSRAPPPPSVLVRKGVVGDWRNHFSKENSRKIEEAFVQKCGHVVKHEMLWDPKDWMENM